MISEFSDKARKKMLFTLMKLDANWQTMITLTYPKDFPNDGRQVKEDLNRFLTWFKRWGTYQEYVPSVFWFLEFQERGAPHIHLITDFIIGDLVERRFVIAERWSHQLASQIEYKDRPSALKRWATMAKMFAVHSHRKQIAPIREKDGAIRYCAKYAYKPEQKIVPAEYQNVGRFWGVTTHTDEYESVTVECDETVLRAYLEVIGHKASKWDVLPKHLFGEGL